MLLLTTTSDLVQLITGSALSTDIVTSYVDITTTGVTPGSFQANVATATTTTIVASPASATQRQVKMISVRNNSTTTAQTVTVQKSTGTAYNITGAITLNPGEVLYYQDMYGFSVRDINGQIKQTINTTSASLTSTYVGYGNSSGVLTGSSTLTYSATGNLVVGAPTTSTAAALTVTGVARTGYGSTVQINAPNTTGQSNGLAITSGTNSSDAPFVLTNAASTFNYYALLGDSSWSYFRAPSTTTLVCSAAGNVSISAPSSGNALASVGASGGYAGYFTNTTTATNSNGVGIYAGSSTSNFALVVGNSTVNTNFLLVNGVGNSTFNAISGTTVSVNGVAGAYAQGIQGGTTSGSSFGLAIHAGTTSGDAALSVSNSGITAQLFNINGVGTVSMPQYTTNGTVTTTGNNGTLTVSSDERLKTNIRPFTRGLEAIQKIDPILYGWSKESGCDPNPDNINYAGFSAQNVMKVIPEAVSEGKDGYYGFADRPVIAALVNAVKEQQSQIDELKSLVKYLMTLTK